MEIIYNIFIKFPRCGPPLGHEYAFIYFFPLFFTPLIHLLLAGYLFFFTRRNGHPKLAFLAFIPILNVYIMRQVSDWHTNTTKYIFLFGLLFLLLLTINQFYPEQHLNIILLGLAYYWTAITFILCAEMERVFKFMPWFPLSILMGFFESITAYLFQRDESTSIITIAWMLLLAFLVRDIVLNRKIVLVKIVPTILIMGWLLYQVINYYRLLAEYNAQP